MLAETALIALCIAVNAQEQNQESRSSTNLPVSVGGILMFLLCIVIYLFDRPKKKYVEFESFEV